MKKKRGAPRGNQNALKHGFYSDQFQQAEMALLARTQTTDLSHEIELFRVQIRRCLEAETASLGQIDYETRLQTLHTLSLAVESLNRLTRTQLVLNALSRSASQGQAEPSRPPEVPQTGE